MECVSGGRQCRSRRTLWKGVKRWVGMGGVDGVLVMRGLLRFAWDVIWGGEGRGEESVGAREWCAALRRLWEVL